MYPQVDQSVSYDVFRYLNAENAKRYAAIMAAFVAAKRRFALHLKPADLLRDLDEANPAELEQDLTRLTEWGNLRRQADTTEVRTVEDFRRARFLYQLSAEGEAAETALAVFRENVETTGELQATALSDIEAGLRELGDLLAEGDEAKLYSAFNSLFSRFEQLAARAQQFIGSVRRAIDLQEQEIEAFLAYKEQLIGYLERFLQQLVLRIPAVSGLLRALPADELANALDRMAERELRDAMDPNAAQRERVRLAWRDRWLGLANWFLPGNGPPQADRLRACARAAIPDLLVVAASLNEQRMQRSDRAADYRELARWFATAESDDLRHRLWREAFCLSPSRHLTIDADTLEEQEAADVSPATSWLDAPPMRISPHLRATGRAKAAGRPQAMVDHREDLAFLQQTLAREAEQLARARARMATGKRLRLSEFQSLDPREFDLFLDCLGSALGAMHQAVSVSDAASSDGSLLVSLERIEDAPEVALATTTGVFSGPDCWVRIREAFDHAR